ncbi:sporulation protein YqfD [Paludifilum halophilum]|uniref:sporulation protein YqfD n=1 Tax=Paludifilum halophilum TaxID=1642702 RepID=UPI00146C748A|nr:sporulation protein YqfD [Paludifilum halophilum]
MQQNHWPQTVRGNLRIELTGSRLTMFINEALNQSIEISRIRWVEEDRIRLTISVSDFYRLKPLLRQTSSKVRIVGKRGVPFLLARLEKRRFFVGGILLFIILLFSLTSLVWSVEVEGNEKIPEREIRNLLKEEGVFIGQIKYRIPSNEEIQNRLTDKLSQATWVGFRMEGTRAVVTVVEKKRVEKKEEEDDRGPVDLVAGKDALIYDMYVKQGRAVVEVNDVVKKGELLVSGRYGDPETPDEGRIAGAQGRVMGRVWYESEVSVPLYQKRKIYTGNREKAYYPYVLSRVIRIPFLYPESFSRAETIQRVHGLRIRDWHLPLGWVEEKRMEMEFVKKKLAMKEAVAIGKERAKEDLLSRLGKEGRILEEKVLHPRVDHGKVVMKIHFDAVEDITRPQPILQGE